MELEAVLTARGFTIKLPRAPPFVKKENMGRVSVRVSVKEAIMNTLSKGRKIQILSALTGGVPIRPALPSNIFLLTMLERSSII